MTPPLNWNESSSRVKSLRALAAAAGSPWTNANAVGPSRRPFSVSAPAFSAARSVSEFFTMRNVVSASRSLARSSAACGTEVPR